MKTVRAAATPAANQAAFDVVGLYGDPLVSWSIALELQLAGQRDPEQLRAGLDQLIAANPHCGAPADWRVVQPEDWQATLNDVSDRPFTDTQPLVRGASTPDGRRAIVAAHHGVVDGLGLLALAGGMIGADLRSNARGIQGASPRRTFLASCAHRLVELIWHPPRRFAAPQSTRRGGERGDGDWLASRVTTAPVDTSRLVTAAAAVLGRWETEAGGRRAPQRHPAVIAIGASRREAGERLRPERATAYLRVLRPSASNVAMTRRLLAQTPPEPAFPESRAGGVAPIVLRLLRSRLGSTALVSNLGRVSGAAGVTQMTFYPAASGPQGIAFAAVTTEGVTTMSVRAVRSGFTEVAVARILELLEEELHRLASSAR